MSLYGRINKVISSYLVSGRVLRVDMNRVDVIPDGSSSAIRGLSVGGDVQALEEGSQVSLMTIDGQLVALAASAPVSAAAAADTPTQPVSGEIVGYPAGNFTEDINADRLGGLYPVATADVSAHVPVTDANGKLSVASLGGIAATGLVTNLNADLVDGYHAGNTNGSVPISNGTLNTNLNADQLDGAHIPANTAFTPTWSTSGTQPSLGNGSLTGRYTKFGSLVIASITLIPGSTTTFGTGGFRFSLPFTAGVLCSGSIWAVDQGTTFRTGVCRVLATESFVTCHNDNNASDWHATSPITWAVNDILNITIAYITG